MSDRAIHASCVAIDGQGVLLAGPPGAGKSDLALRLIDSGAVLVADDQVALSVIDGILMAAPPAALAGLIEVRQIGIIRMPFIPAVAVALYVELVAGDEKLERLPVAEVKVLENCPIRRVKLLAFVASTPAKIRVLLGCYNESYNLIACGPI